MVIVIFETGSPFRKIQEEIVLGLDIHNGCSPVLVKNSYKFSGGAGAVASSGLKFDVVKVILHPV